MLRTKLFKGFALIVIIFTALSTLFGLQTIKQRIMDEAQNKARLDLCSAWSVFNSRLERIQTIIRLLEGQHEVLESCASKDWDNADLRNRLETVRRNFNLDFLGLVAADGEVVFRTTPPFNTGDSKIHDPVIVRALSGEQTAGIVLWSHSDLRHEADGLAERAFMELEDTPHSKISSKTSEDRGMMMLAAAPVRIGSDIVAVVYGGKLLNRNYELVDRIRDLVYGSETYNGIPMGTATIFLGDNRIATTVMLMNGNRALGTRASKDVVDQVLDNGRAWVGEAYVVNDWYLTAYDPISDVEGKIVGMLYVGILRQPFFDYGRNLMIRHGLLCFFALLVALLLAFWLANRLSRPIHRLVEAASHMSQGNGPIEVPTDSACDEVATLILAFNEMSCRLAERENSLKATNRSYMETLGFVAHELKSPIASVVNYLYLLRQQKLGPLTEKQEKALLICERNVHRIVEMIRSYLNLSRIENRELCPTPCRIAVKEEIVSPLVESMEMALKAKNMTIIDRLDPKLCVNADINMTREIFENLVSNAVKYGKKDGIITLTADMKGDFVEFAVANDGPTIPPEQLQNLFQKFFRVDQPGRRERGTGLGLFITRHIVEAHGGTIRIESSDEKGTVVIFTLPKWRGELPL